MSGDANGGRKFRWVGTRPIRHDGVDKVTGRANFGADLAFPDMLWGRVLRSPHAHARIRRIDVAKALALPGVKAVATAADLPDLALAGGGGRRRRHELPRPLAQHASRATRCSITATRWPPSRPRRPRSAELALARDRGRVRAAAARARRSTRRWRRARRCCTTTSPPADADANLPNVAARIVFERGDPKQGFAAADVVVERTFRTQTVHQGYIEPHAVVARTNTDGQSVVWCCTQGPFMVRAYSAAVLGLELSQIKVIPSEIGGGFGGKTTVYCEPLAILLSRKAGRPVKMVMSREEVFRATGPAGAATLTVKFGATKDGRLDGRQRAHVVRGGCLPGLAGDGRRDDNLRALRPRALLDRGLRRGREQGQDRRLPRARRAAGCVRGGVAARRARPASSASTRSSCVSRTPRARARRRRTDRRFKKIGLVETLEAARAHPHYQAKLGPNQGRGVAVGFWFNGGMSSSAEVHLTEEGTAVVASGQSRHRRLARLARDPRGRRARHRRREGAARGRRHRVGRATRDMTGGSRVTFATGMAVIEAARDVVRQLRERAAKLWGCDPALVAFVDGRLRARGGLGPREGAAHRRRDREAARRDGRPRSAVRRSSTRARRGPRLRDARL